MSQQWPRVLCVSHRALYVLHLFPVYPSMFTFYTYYFPCSIPYFQIHSEWFCCRKVIHPWKNFLEPAWKRKTFFSAVSSYLTAVVISSRSFSRIDRLIQGLGRRIQAGAWPKHPPPSLNQEDTFLHLQLCCNLMSGKCWH